VSNAHPLDRLEDGVLDDSVPLATLLRQVVVIGGRASSQALQTWALQELQGYPDAEAELPGYRKIHALLQADSRSIAWEHTGETISFLDLPQIARENLSEEVPITFSIGRLEAMIAAANPGDAVRLAPPRAAEVAKLMTYERRNHGIVVMRVYWTLHLSSLQDILDQVRTRLAQFVAELRSAMPAGEHEPTSEQVHRAVQNINITTGDNSPVTLAAPLAYAEQDAFANASSNIQKHRPWWRRSR